MDFGKVQKKPWKGFTILVAIKNIIQDQGNGTPLKYSYLENPMDTGAW